MARETLVLLSGMMCDARMFAPQIAAFDSDYDIFVPELNAPNMPEMSAQVLANAPSVQLNLCGLSMGGIVAMEILRQAPERIARLALLDTNHLADATENYNKRTQWNADVKAGKLREIIVDWMKPNYLAKANREQQDLLDLFVEMAMDLGDEVFINQNLALRDRKSNEDILPQFGGPSLVLCGQEDALCPPERHEQMAALLPNATLEMPPNAGHISTLEQPEAVNEALRNWLQREV